MSAKRRAAAEDGFTILEAAIALTVLAVALLSLWGTLIYCLRSNQVVEQKMKALNAAQAKVEELKSQPFETLIVEYGPGGNQGDRFGVPSLDDDESLPLDLNGDGDSVDEDVSATYGILPVRVSIEWMGALGRQRMDVRTILKRED